MQADIEEPRPIQAGEDCSRLGNGVIRAVTLRPKYGVAVVVCVERVHLLWVQRVMAAITDASPTGFHPLVTTYFAGLPSLSGLEAKIAVLDAELGCHQLVVDVRRREAVETVVAWLLHPSVGVFENPHH